MKKIFPSTPDGDKITVTFNYDEEKNAFEAVVKAIKEYLANITPRSMGVREIHRGLKLQTTLQAEIATDPTYNQSIRKISGIIVLNVFSKDDVVIGR